MLASATVPLPVQIHAHAARNHHEPAGEVVGISPGELPEAGEIIGSETLENVGVRVHRRVVVAVHRAGGAENELAVDLQERVPGALPGNLIDGGEKLREFRRQGDTSAAPRCFGHGAGSRARVDC